MKKFAELAKFWMLLLPHPGAREQHPSRGVDQVVIHNCPQFHSVQNTVHFGRLAWVSP